MDYFSVDRIAKNLILCCKFILASSLEVIENRFSVPADTRTDRSPSILVPPGEQTLFTNHKPRRERIIGLLKKQPRLLEA